ncbi:SigE family RNA polymerase sigma factor [Streptomyces sp. NPDC051000]|uniref:SigE family RNA polymerase sigma factor n=1 Tax=Streptomyces sp. NPDC051000 TaxID=3155520 RepID=UPI0033E50CAB
MAATVTGPPPGTSPEPAVLLVPQGVHPGTHQDVHQDVHRDAHHDASAEFHAFFERHHAELSRLASMLIGEPDAGADLAADALVAVWHRWDRVRDADHPLAYARGVVANMARTRIRAAVRERRRVNLFWSNRPEVVEAADVASALDVRRALARLPFRKRACVVLRHALDLSEKDTALALGISVGTVKSQTSKGMAELQKLLGARAAGELAGGRTR